MISRGSARRVRARLGSAWHGRSGRCSARQGKVDYPKFLGDRLGKAGHGAAWSGLERLGKARQVFIVSDRAANNRPITCNGAWHGEAVQGGERLGGARRCKAGQGEAKQGKANILII